MGDVEFEGEGGGELRQVSLAGFTELGEAGMVRVGVVCRISVSGPKVFPAVALGKGGNISNHAKMIKAQFRGEDRGFRSSKRLRGEANGRMGQIDRLGISVGRGGLKFGGRVAGIRGDVESLKIEARKERSAKGRECGVMG